VVVLRYGPRFADPALREAVELTVDRHKLSVALFEGRVLVPRTYLVAPGWAASDAGELSSVNRDQARALLLAAGYTRGSFGILEHASDRLAVSILVARGSVARTDAATRLRILEGRRSRLEERIDGFRSALTRTRERVDSYTLELQRHGLESVEREVRWLNELIESERQDPGARRTASTIDQPTDRTTS